MRTPLDALYRVLTVVGIALLITLIVMVSIPPRNVVAITRFDHAQLCVEPPVETALNRAGLAVLLAPVPSDNYERSVLLPHRATRTHFKLMRKGVEPLGRAWYRFSYVLPADWKPDERFTIYSPRLLGVAWQVRVNGKVALDNLDDWRMTWNRPVIATLEPDRLRAGERLDIALGIAFEPARAFALTYVDVGPANVLARRLFARQFFQFVAPIACSVAVLAMGAFFLVFWWLRRSERTHLLLALSAIAWCVFNLQYVLPRRDDPTLDAWYGAVTGPSITWVMWFIYLFVLQLDRRLSRLIALTMPVFVLVMSVIALPVVPLSEDTGVYYQGANVFVAAVITTYICWQAILIGSLELRVISVALAITIVFGVHDLGLLAHVIDTDGIYLLPYSGIVLFGSFLFAVQRRYVYAIDEHEKLSSSLAQRLSEREAELRANHARLVELEKTQALAAERQRLVQDMHDGLGSALTTSLAMIEHGNADNEELKRVLRDSVDDLRAVIDSLEPLDGDLVSVLATLRFRLGKRLELAGIIVAWEMHDVPQVPWLGPPQALQLMRIVQEVLTNILKHAQATQVRIAASYIEPCVEVCIADNGCGFDLMAVSSGRGLRHLSKRAASLHGSILLDSQPGRGTMVRLLLPISIG
jgi:signal transduction histidine kinase